MINEDMIDEDMLDEDTVTEEHRSWKKLPFAATVKYSVQKCNDYGVVQIAIELESKNKQTYRLLGSPNEKRLKLLEQGDEVKIMANPYGMMELVEMPARLRSNKSNNTLGVESILKQQILAKTHEPLEMSKVGTRDYVGKIGDLYRGCLAQAHEITDNEDKAIHIAESMFQQTIKHFQI